jgi:hypothetical protein
VNKKTLNLEKEQQNFKQKFELTNAEKEDLYLKYLDEKERYDALQ